MATLIKGKKDFIAFFAGVEVTDKLIPMSSLDLTFQEDDYMICNECDFTDVPSKFYVKEKITNTSDGVFFCDGCYQDSLKPSRNCSGCGTKIKHTDNPQQVTFHLDGREQEGEVCRACHQTRKYHSSYIPCMPCGMNEAPNRMGLAEGIRHCQECIVRNYYHCGHCEEYHKNYSGRNKSLPTMKLSDVKRKDIRTIIDAEHLSLASLV